MFLYEDNFNGNNKRSLYRMVECLFGKLKRKDYILVESNRFVDDKSVGEEMHMMINESNREI